MYQKSPKKYQELEEVISDLQQCVVFDDAGIRPIRASGSRWASHKLNAMKRVLSKYGAYTSHLITLTSDASVKDVDCAKLRGYVSKWIDAKYLLGCAFFVNLLSPCAIFSKVLQEDDIDILEAFTILLRTVKDVNKLSDKLLEHWKTYSTTIKNITTTSSGGKPENKYQCQGLRNLTQTKSFYEAKHQEYCASVTACLKSRFAWSDLTLIQDIITALATQGWQKCLDEEECESETS